MTAPISNKQTYTSLEAGWAERPPPQEFVIPLLHTHFSTSAREQTVVIASSGMLKAQQVS